MALYTDCPSCRKSFRLPYKASTRSRLQMKEGDELRINCKHCGHLGSRHINEVYKSTNPVFIGLSTALGAWLTFQLLDSYGYISAIFMAIPLIVWKDEERRVKAFNGYMVRRK